MMASYLMTLVSMATTILLPPTTAQLVDLSYTYNQGAPTSPKLRPFHQDIVKRGQNKKLGIWVELNDFCMSEHSGTHLDAPVHLRKDGWSVEAIPTSRLWRRPGVVVDVSRAVASSGNINYKVRESDLVGWEAEHGNIPDGAVVLIRTGWGKRNKTTHSYSGLDVHNKLNFPGVSEKAAQWLTNHKEQHHHAEGIVGVGIDTLSLDNGQSMRYPAHVTLFSHNIYALENLDNLDKLPETGFYLTVLPMRIGGGSGAPARVVAEMGEVVGMHAHAPPRPAAHLALILAALIPTCLLLL